jgi:hypothetical protein
MLDLKNATIQLFVGSYARRRSSFSPLVEFDGTPSYSRLEGSNIDLTWAEIAHG